jgi:hypothetical protein
MVGMGLLLRLLGEKQAGGKEGGRRGLDVVAVGGMGVVTRVGLLG